MATEAAGRAHQRILYVSQNHTGKSTVMLETIRKSYDLKKQVAVIVLEEPSAAYNGIHRCETYEELAALKSGLVTFYKYEEKGDVEMLNNIISEVLYKGGLRNGCLAFEDATNYIPSNVPPAIRKFLGNHRAYELDLFFCIHSLTDVPPFLRRRANYISLGKTSDVFSKWEQLQSLNFPNSYQLFAAYVAAQQSTNQYFRKTVLLQ